MGWLENTYNKAKKAVKKTASNVSDFVGDAKDKVVDTAGDAYNYVASGEALDDAKGVYNYVVDKGKDAYNYVASGEALDDAKDVYGKFMDTKVGKAIADTWNKYYAMPPKPAEGGANGAYSAANPPTTFDNSVTLSTDTQVVPDTQSQNTGETGGAYGAAPTYEQWKAQGGASAGAYQSYLDSVKSADKELERQKNAAMTNYELARSNYGAEGEAMRSVGLTGGYSDYLDSKAYALAQGNIASAERTAAEAKRDAESDLYAKYDEKIQQLEKIKIDSLGYSPDDLYALSKSVGSTLSQAEYDTIVNDWLAYNEKKGNASAISEYSKLSGKENNENGSIANAAKNIDVSSADANSPTAIIDSLGSVAQSVKDTVIANVASKFVSDGKTRTYKRDGDFSGLNNFNKGQKFHFDFAAGTNMFGKDRIKTEYVDIDTTYEASSNMYKLLEQMANGADILVFNNALYVKGTAKNGETRWIKTDQKDVT